METNEISRPLNFDRIVRAAPMAAGRTNHAVAADDSGALCGADLTAGQALVAKGQHVTCPACKA